MFNIKAFILMYYVEANAIGCDTATGRGVSIVRLTLYLGMLIMFDRNKSVH